MKTTFAPPSFRYSSKTLELGVRGAGGSAAWILGEALLMKKVDVDMVAYVDQRRIFVSARTEYPALACEPRVKGDSAERLKVNHRCALVAGPDLNQTKGNFLGRTQAT